MRIAVIADTHNRLPSSVRAELTTADEIWHLGDICAPEILKELRALGPAVHAIGGNCDPRGLAPETLTLQREGHTFFLVHEPPHSVPPSTGFALHGHTHVPRDETLHGVRHLNPGSVGKANHGAPSSFAWLDLDPDLAPRWTVVPVN